RNPETSLRIYPALSAPERTAGGPCRGDPPVEDLGPSAPGLRCDRCGNHPDRLDCPVKSARPQTEASDDQRRGGWHMIQHERLASRHRGLKVIVLLCALMAIALPAMAARGGAGGNGGGGGTTGGGTVSINEPAPYHF